MQVLMENVKEISIGRHAREMLRECSLIMVWWWIHI